MWKRTSFRFGRLRSVLALAALASLIALSITMEAIFGTRGAGQEAGFAAMDPSKTTLLTKELGVVAPNTEHICRFLLRNDSATPWRIGEVRRTCGCTSVLVSTDTIAPGSTGTFDIKYRAGTSSADDMRSVVVKTAEPEQREVILRIKAAVRAPLCVAPEPLMLSLVGEPSSGTALVLNYSSEDWAGLTAVPEVAGCSVVVSPAGAAEVTPRTREAWKLAVSAGNGSCLLATGFAINLKAHGASSGIEYRGRLRVTLPRSKGAAIVPDRAFFGPVVRGSTAERTLVLRLPQERAAGEPILRHNIGNNFSVNVVRGQANIFLLHCAFHATAGLGVVNGTLFIGFSDDTAELSVPVLARVISNDQHSD
jgi:hypothetical protein